MFRNNYPAQWPRKATVASVLTAVVVALGILLPIPARAQTEAVIYDFNYLTRTAEGCPYDSFNVNPHTGVVFSKGHLYGTTPQGGAGAPNDPNSKDGMVYEVSKSVHGKTPWPKKTLHSFQPEASTEGPAADGLYPCSSLIDDKGILYGSTLYGGISGLGTIYALVPPGVGETGWIEYQIYTFLGQDDGAFPYDGLVMDGNGAFYGVNRGGFSTGAGPTVFQLVCGSGSCTAKSLLTNNENVTYNGDLLLDATTGALYGTTHDGGKGYGNVFSLTPSSGSWAYADLYDFTGNTDGAYPNGGLVMAGDGSIFGTTQGGGTGIAGAGDGVLFELRQLTAGSPYTLEVQHTFSGEPDGSTPVAGLYEDASGNFWGTTTLGGSSNMGTIFELYPDRLVVEKWHYLEPYSFAGGLTDGANPQGRLTEDQNGNLYGTTNTGGSAGEGIVFQLSNP
jgi:uncharacterized repeat protein (TIGR03803 family)